MSEAPEKVSKVLELKEVGLSYGDHKVLEKVSFAVREGDCVVVIGGSGCGKSTVLKAMTGLLEPNGGKVMVRGRLLGLGFGGKVAHHQGIRGSFSGEHCGVRCL